ncbi:MerR family transcriptional regulator [Effusibacillus dendaii]|uniref:MerR family transcriptional regulator n=1 Tax=Effusibacillus dendaii TaxID=2743772 RepID=A0A7I8DFF1_9BACL|nr:MerR family transcriptional regulator [Effusibacillus dendaii]BCJ86641.1 MerR family transcriptional regulator [Effusibacillus dendaii]
MTYFKIDDVAKETGLTKRTIRYYEEIGLINPPERTDGGVRLYTRRDIERLQKINDARQVLGFSLQELLQFLQLNESIRDYRDNRQKRYDRSQMAELENIEKTLQQQITMIDQKISKMALFREEAADLLDRLQTLQAEIKRTWETEE